MPYGIADVGRTCNMNIGLRLVFVAYSILLLQGQSFGQASSGTATNIQVRIKNDSDYLITKLIIFNRTFENLKSGDVTEYFEIEPFYPSIRIDITTYRKRILRRDYTIRTLVQPIDNVGERLITSERNTLVVDIQKDAESRQEKLVTKVIAD